MVDNTDQIKLALTMQQGRGVSHNKFIFLQRAPKSMAVSALRDLCLREQEISPHTDSRDMEPLYDKQHERSSAQTEGRELVIKNKIKSKNNVLKYVQDKKVMAMLK